MQVDSFRHCDHGPAFLYLLILGQVTIFVCSMRLHHRDWETSIHDKPEPSR